jgi:hypothetical protein
VKRLLAAVSVLALLSAPAAEAGKRKKAKAAAPCSAQAIAGTSQAVWYITATVVVEGQNGAGEYDQQTRVSTCRAVLRPRGRDVTATVRCESDFVGSPLVSVSYTLTDDPASGDQCQWLVEGNGTLARINFNRAGTMATGGGQIGLGQPTETGAQQVRTADLVAIRQ